METGLLIQNILSVFLSVGVPVIILLALAVEIGRWHEAQPEVPDEVFREKKEH
jgi:hypothetical protein